MRNPVKVTHTKTRHTTTVPAGQARALVKRGDWEIAVDEPVEYVDVRTLGDPGPVLTPGEFVMRKSAIDDLVFDPEESDDSPDDES